MVIGPNFVFIAVPRTASNTIARLFLPQFGGVNHHHNHQHHRRDVPKEHAHKFTFAVVRNPYDRMLSCYYHLAEGDQQFGIKDMTTAEFMRFLMAGWGEGGWCLTRFLAAARIDMHLRYETLDREVWRLPFVAPLDPRRPQLTKMQRLNAAKRPDWRMDLTPEFVALVNEHSAEDFDAYGYERLAA